jgi:hypothetical protein
VANPLDLLGLLTTLIKALVEAVRAVFFMDVGATKAKLKGMEDAENALNAARDAANADSLPVDTDPDNRDNR